MATLKNALFSLKKNVRNKVANLKNNLKNGAQEFKEKFKEVKSQPKSKRKSLLIDFTTIVGIFGVTLLTPVLSAVAKDLPKDKPGQAPGPNQVCPSPVTATTSKDLVRAVIAASSTVCGLAVSSAPFMVGAACGLLVVYGILKMQGK